MCDLYVRRYANNESALAVDQHCLLASIAPRPLYVASAEDDLHCDPRGEFESIRAADPVYTLLLRDDDNDKDDDDDPDRQVEDCASVVSTAFFGAAQQQTGAALLDELTEGPVNLPVGAAGGRLRYHRRSGGHDVTRYDWDQYLTFAEEHFGMQRPMDQESARL